MSIIYKNYLHSIKYLEKEEFYEDKKALSQTFFFNNKKSKPMFGKKLLKCLKDISRFTRSQITR